MNSSTTNFSVRPGAHRHKQDIPLSEREDMHTYIYHPIVKHGVRCHKKKKHRLDADRDTRRMSFAPLTQLDLLLSLKTNNTTAHLTVNKHARRHARTHARTHAHTHTHTQSKNSRKTRVLLLMRDARLHANLRKHTYQSYITLYT